MPPEVVRKLAAILSADVVGYSRLMAEHEGATVAALESHRERVETRVRERNGRLVDFTGDNFLAEFPTATEALGSALAIQLAVGSSASGAAPRMQFRIGIHVGEVRVEGERLYGSGVNTAARLEGLAEPGGVCISGTVFEQVRRVAGLEFDDLGLQHLKNLPDPVHAYGVRAIDAASAPIAGEERREPAVAVLPFVNMSPDPDQEFFADGMAEELINALTQVDGLRVISRTSAFSFKNREVDVATIGRELDVSALVEGSVRKARDRLRITAQLIDVEGGHHLWSEVYDRSLDDVFQIQDEIARAIVTRIKPKLLGETGARLVARATESRAAYDLYLRAAERIASFDRWDTRTAIEMLKDATGIDPEYADAWARLALAYSQLELAFEPDAAWHDRAEEAVQRAFALDANNADAFFARGRMLWTPHCGFQHCPALRALRRSLELKPGSNQARIWEGLILLHVGLMDEARETLRTALAAQPEDSLTLHCLGQTFQLEGHYEEASEYVERGYRADPTLWLNDSFLPPLHIYLDDFDRAERRLADARQARGDDPMFDSCEGLLWARRGERERAEAALARAREDRPSVAHDHHRHHYCAAAHAVLGDEQAAIDSVRTSIETGLPNYSAFATDRHLVSLQTEPEFTALLADLERQRAELRSEFGTGAD